MNIIKNIQKETGLTQTELARKLGVTQPRISEYATGKVNMSVNRLMSWCDILNINPSKILNHGNNSN